MLPWRSLASLAAGWAGSWRGSVAQVGVSSWQLSWQRPGFGGFGSKSDGSVDGGGQVVFMLPVPPGGRNDVAGAARLGTEGRSAGSP